MCLQLLRIVGAVVHLVAVLRNDALQLRALLLLFLTSTTFNYQALLLLLHLLSQGLQVFGSVAVGSTSVLALTGLELNRAT